MSSRRTHLGKARVPVSESRCWGGGWGGAGVCVSQTQAGHGIDVPTAGTAPSSLEATGGRGHGVTAGAGPSASEKGTQPKFTEFNHAGPAGGSQRPPPPKSLTSRTLSLAV